MFRDKTYPQNVNIEAHYQICIIQNLLNVIGNYRTVPPIAIIEAM